MEKVFNIMVIIVLLIFIFSVIMFINVMIGMYKDYKCNNNINYYNKHIKDCERYTKWKDTLQIIKNYLDLWTVVNTKLMK